MGVERVIQFESSPPPWEAIREELHRAGFPVVLRMIDGLPAFPDEVPDAGWNELRVGFAPGMVTLRRGEDRLRCVVWGNADAELLRVRDELVRACAAAGEGTIVE